MKKLKEDAVPVNATGSGVVGTDGDTSFSPRLFAMLKRKAIERKKKSKDGRKK
jgi:hypothetical protein